MRTGQLWYRPLAVLSREHGRPAARPAAARVRRRVRPGRARVPRAHLATEQRREDHGAALDRARRGRLAGARGRGPAHVGYRQQEGLHGVDGVRAGGPRYVASRIETEVLT